MKTHKNSRLAAMSIVALAGSHALAGDRDVQFTRVFTDTHVIEMTNTGDAPVSLGMWQFCTQNSASVFNYSIGATLIGRVLQPQESMTIHMNNDADPGDPTQMNRIEMGGFASFELTAYSLAIYSPGSQGFINFANGNQMIDFVQWSIDGLDNFTADERSDEAVSGGLWTNAETWINVQNDTTLIELDDPTFGQLHGPDSYAVSGAVSCLADLTGDGVLDFFDISTFLTAFGIADPAADFTGDGSFDFFDISTFLIEFSSGCP